HGSIWSGRLAHAIKKIKSPGRGAQATKAVMQILRRESFKHYIDFFNSMEAEGVVNLIPNATAWDWIEENIPFFTCPDRAMEEMYYFRWWSFRKHIKQTPVGRIITEFIEAVKHA